MAFQILHTLLSRPTSILGLRLWVLLTIAAAAFLLLLLIFLLLLNRLRRQQHPPPLRLGQSSGKPLKAHLQEPNPAVSMEISDAKPHPQLATILRIDIPPPASVPVVLSPHQSPPPPPASTSGTTADGESQSPIAAPPTVVPNLGWGQWYSLRQLEEATGGLAEVNVIGEGGYGIVYRGILPDNTVIAVKNLLNNRGQAEREFRVEVEAIGRVRHKNLVKLLGYCVEGTHRMLVYEYVDNGNLDQWLHGDIGTLTWDIRMSIILGTAKGLAYLHDGLEPKVVHRDVKSSNILIDRQWNPKVSDFGLAKLLQSERSYVTTRVMGTFGYVAPEYASTGMLNETSDVYSFGVLIMEIISGRNPVDYGRPQREVHLVEWLKVMVGEWRSEEVADPKMPERPPPKAIKRALLVALRCVDPDAKKRPKMGHVIHMLEMDDSLFRDHRKVGRESDRHEAEEESFSRHGLHTKSRWVDSNW